MRVFGEDFEEDVKIDKKQLEEENVYQPAMYFCWSNKLADARTELDFAKDTLNATRAKKELHYRRNPPDDMKITEGVISALVADDRDIQDALDTVTRVQEAVNTLYAVVNAAEQRKCAVDNLVKLSLASYYNSTETGDSVQEARSRLNKKGE